MTGSFSLYYWCGLGGCVFNPSLGQFDFFTATSHYTPSPSLGLVPVPSPHHNHCGLSKMHIWWGLPPSSKAPLLTAWSWCALNGVKVTHFSRFLSLALCVLLFSVPRILCSSPSTLPPTGLPLPSLLQVSPAEGTTLCCMCAHRVCDPALRSSGDRKLLGDGDCIMFIYTPKAEPCACYIVDCRLFKGKAITLKC